LGQKPQDKDFVVVGSTPEEMINQGFKRVGKDFPVFLHPKTKEEYALARKERKTAKGHDGFFFDYSPAVTLEQDLFRRDITINAMAMEDSNLIDPFNGKRDLEKKIIRHVSDHFKEDPLRVLRVARFAARFSDFTVHEDTIAIMREIALTDELQSLSGERVYMEMEKAMETSKPEIFFEVLDKCGALEILFPELAKLKGVPQTKKYHPEGDAWIHTMLVLKNACKLSGSKDIRIAALLHDLGKGTTPKDILPSHHGHEEGGLPLIENFANKYKLPKKTLDLALKVCKFHLLAHKVFELKPSTLLDLLNSLDAFRKPDLLESFLICTLADNLGKLNETYPQREYIIRVFNALNEIDLSEATQQDNPEKIKEMIREIRIKAIKKVPKEF
jgi:tRNA nucleotidyltransferase (CCA-adding enzyme)